VRPIEIGVADRMIIEIRSEMPVEDDGIIAEACPEPGVGRKISGGPLPRDQTRLEGRFLGGEVAQEARLEPGALRLRKNRRNHDDRS